MENSLGFALARRGYDVWLGNLRGNTYSLGHVNYSVKCEFFFCFLDAIWSVTFLPAAPKYWKFAYDHHIDYDFPAMVDYILATAGAKTIGYVGHSTGGFTAFAHFSTSSKYDEIVKPVIGLAPDVYAASTGNPGFLVNEIVTPFLTENPGPLLRSSLLSKVEYNRFGSWLTFKNASALDWSNILPTTRWRVMQKLITLCDQGPRWPCASESHGRNSSAFTSRVI